MATCTPEFCLAEIRLLMIKMVEPNTPVLVRNGAEFGMTFIETFELTAVAYLALSIIHPLEIVLLTAMFAMTCCARHLIVLCPWRRTGKHSVLVDLALQGVSRLFTMDRQGGSTSAVGSFEVTGQTLATFLKTSLDRK